MKAFGIKIKEEYGFDVQNIIARLYLAPSIMPDQAMKILVMLENKTLSIDRVLKLTDKELNDLTFKKGNGEDLSLFMLEKVALWRDEFGLPTPKEYEYLKKEFGITKEDLQGLIELEDNYNDYRQSPQAMASYVKQFIKGQDEAIDKLSVQFYLHLDSKRKQYCSKIKTPCLLMGPTGVGKSEIFRRFAQLCDCPVIRINTSEIVPSAWKGLHISEIIGQELKSYVTVKDLEYAIIIFHEFDKIVHYNQQIVGNHRTDMDSDLMRDIMRLFETEHSIQIVEGTSFFASTKSLPVDNLLIVLDGAFNGINEIIKKRLNVEKTIGFNSTQSNKYEGVNLQKYVTSDDLEKFGFMPELLGRIGDVAVLNPLSEDVIYEIITTAKDNILQSHIEFCQKSNLELKFEDDALWYIASEAHKSGLGFRNVKTLLSKAMNNVYFNMSKYQTSENKVINITKELVMNNIQVKQL